MQRMASASDALIDVLGEAAASGCTLLGDLFGARAFEQWEHYPENDLVDAQSGVLAFYHAHDPAERSVVEHGHFHCFVDRTRLGDNAPPLARPRARVAREVCHVIAVSLDLSGVPTRLFTTNRWVTGEWLYPADLVGDLVGCFGEVAGACEAAPTLRWISALVALFEPQVRAVLAERDEALRAGGRDVRRRSLDHRQDILSAIDIDVDAQLAMIDEWRAGFAPRVHGLRVG
jgi:hypothetical protein